MLPKFSNFIAITLSLMISLAAGVNAEARSSRAFFSQQEAIAQYNLGVNLFQCQRNGEATTAFSTALSLDPSLQQAHGPLGQLLFLGGDYRRAVPELTAASNIEPYNPSVWCQLGISASRIHQFNLSVQAFQRYLALEPQGGYSQEAKRSIAIMTDVLRGSDQEDSSTFLNKFSGRMHRWHLGNQPLAVYINSADSQDRNIVLTALKEWTEISNGALRFQLTADPAQARIYCSWTDDRRQLLTYHDLGKTELRFNSQGDIQHANVVFLREDRSSGPSTTTDRIRRSYAVALHELGHALGLQHSENPRDIMCCTIAPAGLECAPSIRDKNTVLALYQQ